MSSARDEILTHLRTQARQKAPPPAWRSRLQIADPVGAFITALQAVQGEAFHSRNWGEAVEQLGERLRQLDARRVVINDEPPLDRLDVQARWPHIDWHIVGQTPGDLRAFCTAADAGVSSARAALASTGTIVVDSGPGKSRLATLLPPVHLALLPVGCLTADLLTWMAARTGDMAAAVTLISGPSRTGDIERTLAVGMHGPQRFIVILYDD